VVARITGEFVLTDEGKATLVKHGLPQALADAIATISVTATNAGIALKPVGQSAFELMPTPDGSFYAAGPGIRLKIVAPASGPATDLLLEQGPVSIAYRRK
jgi:hypothetical protein